LLFELDAGLGTGGRTGVTVPKASSIMCICACIRRVPINVHL
jgi:hypothetical protein